MLRGPRVVRHACRRCRKSTANAGCVCTTCLVAPRAPERKLTYAEPLPKAVSRGERLSAYRRTTRCASTE